MIRLGNALVSLERREAFLDGKPLPLGGRAFDVLAMLVRAKGRVVSKEELFSQVWAGTVVEDNNLQVQVSLLRKMLGDKRLIQTVARRGYRLAVDIAADLASFAHSPSFNLDPDLPPPSDDGAAVPVLVVDDDPSVRSALGRLLRVEGILTGFTPRQKSCCKRGGIRLMPACCWTSICQPPLGWSCRTCSASSTCRGRWCS